MVAAVAAAADAVVVAADLEESTRRKTKDEGKWKTKGDWKMVRWCVVERRVVPRELGKRG